MSGDTSFPVDLRLQSESDEFDRTLGPAVREALSRGSSTEELPEDVTSDCPHLTRFVESDNAWTVEEDQHIAACPHCQRRLRVAARMASDVASSDEPVMLARQVEIHRLKGRFQVPVSMQAKTQEVKQDCEWTQIVLGHEVQIQQYELDGEWLIRVQTQAAELSNSMLSLELSPDEDSPAKLSRGIELLGTSAGWLAGEATIKHSEIVSALGQRDFHVALRAE